MSETNGTFQIPDDLRIVELTVENVKRIEAAAISPSDEVTKIGGFNENGKSSLIDSISYTLCGGRVLPAEPLRRGAKKGFSRVQIGSKATGVGLVAERRYTKKGDTLTVKLDGQDEPVTAPQRLLDSLYNANAAQPDDFLDLKPKDKLTLLQKVVGISFDDLNEQSAKLYDERKGVNREVALLEGQIAAMPYYDDAKEPVDVAVLSAELKQAEEANKQIAAKAGEIQTLTAQVEQYDAEIASLRERAITLKGKQAELNGRLETLAGSAAVPVSTEELAARLLSAQEVNEKVDANARRRELEKQMRGKSSSVTKLTLALEKIVEEKEARLAEAKFPVSGLSFSDDGVLLNGLPLEQASQEQQIVTAAAIALAQQPALKAILMRRGSLLDAKHQAALREWAKENKCQVFLEVVGKDSDCQVIIENGRVEGEDAE